MTHDLREICSTPIKRVINYPENFAFPYVSDAKLISASRGRPITAIFELPAACEKALQLSGGKYETYIYATREGEGESGGNGPIEVELSRAGKSQWRMSVDPLQHWAPTDHLTVVFFANEFLANGPVTLFKIDLPSEVGFKAKA